MTLMRHTTDEVADRKALTVNPAKTCQPIGAMYAALGIHRCLPHSHGSQGCCSYHRSTLTRHYKEPVMASTSSFTEGSSVFGGQANLMQSFENVFTIYDADIIAVHTTCLSETIGDDSKQIRQKFIDEKGMPEGKEIIYTSTPSYVGSHVTGFSNMVTDTLKQLAEPTSEEKPQGKHVNILPGWVEPADMREIKRICELMGVDYVMLPDTSMVLDTPQTNKHEMYPEGGTRIDDIKRMGQAQFTLAMGHAASGDAAKALNKSCKVDGDILDLPIGLKATDRFVNTLRKVAGVPVPKSLIEERGRLIDLVSDMHQYLYGKRVALWGDPDQLYSLAEFLLDIDMKPVYMVTGTPGKKLFEKRVAADFVDRCPEMKFKGGATADMFLMHQWIKNEGVDLLIGNTYGKFIARDENTPLLRHGFPILDRVGHQYFNTVGYTGAIRLVEQMLNMFLDKQDAESDEPSFELVM